MLAANFPTLQVGAVYFEDGSGEDEVGDVIEVIFAGGAPGTQLTELVIDTDKDNNGPVTGDTFFDVDDTVLHAYAPGALSIVADAGIDSVKVDVDDGGQTLTMRFTGFDPGERLVFSVDVDEWGRLSPNAVAEGNEFEASILTATFSAPHYYVAAGDDLFMDIYDAALANSGLDLPNDDYVPPSQYMPPTAEPGPVYTAAAIFPVEQTPLPITIAGTVFEDFDLNNFQDPADPGLPDVDLVLYGLQGTQYFATTDLQGNYLFDNVLPDTYRIVESQPTGYYSVGATAGTVAGHRRGSVTGVNVIDGVALLGGDDSIDNDFAEARPATLAGNVYHDVDNDGLFDPGESGIADVLVQVQRVGPGAAEPVIETRSLADGSWSVGDLRPGDYQVVEIQPTGYFDGLDAAGTAGGVAHSADDRIDGFRLQSGQAGREYNFGELLPASISGRVHAETTGNCAYDPGELLLAGVTIELLDPAGKVLATTKTDDVGEYIFSGLEPGVYGVHEVQPDDYYDGPDHVGSVGGALLATDSIVNVSLASSVAAVRYDFCELPPASISGQVFVDLNGNCVRDQGELLLDGVTIHLLDDAGHIVDTTQTDPAGQYAFTGLEPGIYGVREIQPDEYYDGPERVGSAGGSLLPPDSIIDADLTPGTDGIHYDFCETPPVSISGYVYADDNDDGLFDAAEDPIANVKVVLLDAKGTPTADAPVYTDATGFYRFDGLRPGTYGVAEDQPEKYYDGKDTPGKFGGNALPQPGDRITDAVLKAGVAAENYNFGELRPASISGRVHVELDLDCIHDPGEPLLEGVVIYLLDADNNRIDDTLTDKLGEYSFTNLEPGTYGVEEIQPEGYMQGRNHEGSAGGTVTDDVISGAVLPPGTDAVHYNFCELIPASISGYVFQDGPTIMLLPGDTMPEVADVRDGRFTSDDTPLAGVTLQLRDATGAPILDDDGLATATVTDAAGYYEFTGLAPLDAYTVFEVQPKGFIDGIDTVGSHGGDAVNPHSGDYDGLVTLYGTLGVDLADDAIVKIFVSPGDVATQYNFSEVRVDNIFWHDRRDPDPEVLPDPPPPPFPDPPPIVFLTPPPSIDVRPFIGDAGGPLDFSWHLSVVNAGRPRHDRPNDNSSIAYRNSRFDPVAWTGPELNQAQWLLTDFEGENKLLVVKRFLFGLPGGTPVTGDFNGDGIDEVAVYVDGHWFLDLDGDGIWTEEDLWAQLGDELDQPVAGDWDGDGKADIGIFGPSWVGDPKAIAAEPGLPNAGNPVDGHLKNMPPKPEDVVGHRTLKRTARSELRADVIDHVFRYGKVGDQGVAGDFNGDGVAGIGVFRDGVWTLDVDGDGRWTDADARIEFGEPGDVAVVGDFNGDGIDNLGVYRNGIWMLDTNGNCRLDDGETFSLGTADDKPVAGDFDGDGIDEVALYRDQAPQPPEQHASQ